MYLFGWHLGIFGGDGRSDNGQDELVDNGLQKSSTMRNCVEKSHPHVLDFGSNFMAIGTSEFVYARFKLRLFYKYFYPTKVLNSCAVTRGKCVNGLAQLVQ